MSVRNPRRRLSRRVIRGASFSLGTGEGPSEGLKLRPKLQGANFLKYLGKSILGRRIARASIWRQLPLPFCLWNIPNTLQVSECANEWVSSLARTVLLFPMLKETAVGRGAQALDSAGFLLT